MSAGCVNKARRERGENGPLKWVEPSQAGRLEMSSPLIPQGTETENKWSLTPLFSQGPASDLLLLRNMGWSWCSPPGCWAVQWSVSSTQWRSPLSPTSLPHPNSILATDHSTACSVALLTTQSACSHHDDPGSNWSIKVGRHQLVWLTHCVFVLTRHAVDTNSHCKKNIRSWEIKWIFTEK